MGWWKTTSQSTKIPRKQRPGLTPFRGAMASSAAIANILAAKSHWATLQLTKDAPAEELRKQYRRLVRIQHSTPWEIRIFKRKCIFKLLCFSVVMLVFGGVNRLYIYKISYACCTYIYIHTYTYVYLYAHTWHFRIYIYSLVEGFPVISAKVLDGEMVMVLPGFFFSVSEVCQVKKGGFEWKEVRKIWSQLWMSWIINSSWRNFKDGWIAPKTNPLLFIPPTKKNNQTIWPFCIFGRLALLVHPDKCSEIPEAKVWNPGGVNPTTGNRSLICYGYMGKIHLSNWDDKISYAFTRYHPNGLVRFCWVQQLSEKLGVNFLFLFLALDHWTRLAPWLLLMANMFLLWQSESIIIRTRREVAYQL